MRKVLFKSKMFEHSTEPKTAELLDPSKVTPYTGKISSLLMKTTIFLNY